MFPVADKPTRQEDIMRTCFDNTGYLPDDDNKIIHNKLTPSANTLLVHCFPTHH